VPDVTSLRRQSRPAAWALTLWMVLWVPVVLWAYGPQNFFWLCNAALFLILYSLWAGDRLILSSQAGTVTLIGVVWTIDLALGLATGGRTALVTSYMWNPEIPLLARTVSLYHVFLPVLAIGVLARWGYDRRGPWLQCGIGALLIIGSWLFTDPARNINWVAAPFDVEQRWIAEPIWVVSLVVLCPVLVFYPGHRLVRLALRRLRTG
jgi:hypothetical protein